MSSNKNLQGLVKQIMAEITMFEEANQVLKAEMKKNSEAEKLQAKIEEVLQDDVQKVVKSLHVFREQASKLKRTNREWNHLEELEKQTNRREAHDLLQKTITARHQAINLIAEVDVVAHKNRHLQEHIPLSTVANDLEDLEARVPNLRQQIEQNRFEEILEYAPEITGDVNNINISLETIEADLLLVREFIKEDNLHKAMELLVKDETLLEYATDQIRKLRPKTLQAKAKILESKVEKAREIYHSIIQKFSSESEADSEIRVNADQEWIDLNNSDAYDYPSFEEEFEMVEQAISRLEQMLEQ